MNKQECYKNLAELGIEIASTDSKTVSLKTEDYCSKIEYFMSYITDDLKKLSAILTEIMHAEPTGYKQLESYIEEHEYMITVTTKHIIDEFLETNKINQELLTVESNQYNQLLNLIFVLGNFRLDYTK